MESRPLRYFVAVAEQRNFTRAAERLGIAAPAPSRAIRNLEAELGVRLFERSTRVVELTVPGEVLLAQVRPALESLDAATRRTVRASAPDRRLVLAVKADADGGLLEHVLAAVAEEPDAEPVSVRLCGWREHARLLRTGEADAALMFQPYDPGGIDADVVALEPRVAALPAGHPLAGAATVRPSDLGINADEIDDRAERDIGAHGVHDLAQLLALVGLGATATVLPRSVAARYPRRAVAYVPLADCRPAVLVIAWPEHSHSLGVAALVRAAAAAADARGMGASRPSPTPAPPAPAPAVSTRGRGGRAGGWRP
ncbi:putative LysR family transcriptional regulator [Actinacidiphila reveromycinica]|uniref:Putative LysR family transcriptional regulator n=1 Tax=Actinacidiphila reveromycinica TaxID=659352 RepID=A0A7U3UZR4_9ACTN|nr:LysR family transcriptional regulator [Streptomyces sp. SN-593]BBB01647.1 putative LysR family transcriptional regulator [Streptomyces sp. SN-593]